MVFPARCCLRQGIPDGGIFRERSARSRKVHISLRLPCGKQQLAVARLSRALLLMVPLLQESVGARGGPPGRPAAWAGRRTGRSQAQWAAAVESMRASHTKARGKSHRSSHPHQTPAAGNGGVVRAARGAQSNITYRVYIRSIHRGYIQNYIRYSALYMTAAAPSRVQGRIGTEKGAAENSHCGT